MRFYDRNIGDWRAATQHLSDVEECIYSRLIDSYYLDEHPLPADLPACCRLARARTREARAAVAVVLAEFFTLQTDGWHQKRCDREIAAYREQIGKRSKAANARWHADANASKSDAHASGNGDAHASKNDASGNANHEPGTMNQEPGPSPVGSVSENTGVASVGIPANGKTSRSEESKERNRADRWRVPGLNDIPGLERWARAHDINPQRFADYPALFARCVEVAKVENRAHRIRNATRRA